MNIITLNEENMTEVLSLAERTLRSGGIVVSPTDTVYGILGDATKVSAIRKAFRMKERIKEKVFPVFVRNVETARKYAYISDAKAKFLEKIWPGPMTAVFHHKEKMPSLLTAARDTIGIRIPRHLFLQKLLAQVETPLLQTSANISAYPPAKNAKEVRDYFGSAAVGPDLIIDGGEVGVAPSAVIDFTRETPFVIRTGTLSKADFDDLFSSVV